MGNHQGEHILEDINYALSVKTKALQEAVKEYAFWRYYTGFRANPNDLRASFPAMSETVVNTYPRNQINLSLTEKYGGTQALSFTTNAEVLSLTFNGSGTNLWDVIVIQNNSYNNYVKKNFIVNASGDKTDDVAAKGYANILLMPVLV